MMDLEREQLWKTYQLCRTAFVLLAVALIPPCIESLVTMVALMGDRGLFRWLVNSQINHWVSTISVWASLAGTMLLWGRWNQPSWQRRTGFLMLMCVADLVLWFLERGDQHGQGPLSWFRSNLGSALGWAEFALLASLSGDYLVHLGLDPAEDSAKSTRSLAATGAVVWMLRFCESTNWERGWPLQPRNPGFQGYMLLLASELIWTITLIQVTVLVVAAVRHSNRTLQEMEREEQQRDVMSWPHEQSRDNSLATLEPTGQDIDPWAPPADSAPRRQI
jgi:hypothetical protein